MNRMLLPAGLVSLVLLCASGLPGRSGSQDSKAAAAGDPRVAFEQAWESWDALPPGREKDALAIEVDRLAGQRYATVSRLYWHRDLDSARAAASDSGRPILALRMLGRLDEELSCANSRFFRVALYADRELSSYLREHFELAWTSERPVPVARIDFGDGRVLERPVAGNSAHFVLDRRGRPVDVLPGLYGPAAFRSVLERSESIAHRVAELDGDAADRALAEFHNQRIGEHLAIWESLPRPTTPELGSGLMAAQGLTRNKSPVELPLITNLELGPKLPLSVIRQAERSSVDWAEFAAVLPGVKLDERSRALVAAMAPSDWSRPGRALDERGLDELVAGFERLLAEDSAFNEHELHLEISTWFASGQAPRDLAELSAKVYDELFLTPASDPWLGMATPGIFTALTGDGVLVE